MALVQLNPMLGHCVQNFANYCTPCSFNAQHFGNYERIVESKKLPILYFIKTNFVRRPSISVSASTSLKQVPSTKS